MIRFKIFSDADAQALERTVNEWLTKSEPDVKMMEQTDAPSGRLTVSFLYDEGFLATENRLTEEASAIIESALKEKPLLDPLKVDE